MSVQDISFGTEIAFKEDIRLVIWDLDETFWRGTLTEGGISINAGHVEIVKTLAARGIMSSICSKNDHEPVQRLLEEQGVWQYFVFPDISWEAKGPRVKQIIEQVQLRPATVLFVDDNPTNLAEVKRYVPDINVVSETFIPGMLAHARLAGKDDSSLSRLQQYKQMEGRQLAQQANKTDPTAFLRESNITVEFVYDIKPHMDRVVELINRTNQLNFTKNRLSENSVVATEQVADFTERGFFQCALIKVKDSYGDHGFCGFYMTKVDTRDLWHFCFSCRILGLGVEQWVYEKLGRPAINVVGEVLSDLNEPRNVDWINQLARDSDREDVAPMLLQAVTTRGGCELAAVVHYFAGTSVNSVGEYHFYRNGLPIRMDHSIVLNQGLNGLTEAQRDAAVQLDFLDEDFKSRIFTRFADGHVVILSFAVDAFTLLFRHKASGFIAPVLLPNVTWSGLNAEIDPSLDEGRRAAAQRVIDIIQAEYEPLGLIDEDRFKLNLKEALDRIPKSTDVLILGLFESAIQVNGAFVPPWDRISYVNNWTRDVIKRYSNVQLMRMEEFAEPTDSISDHFHFNRMVYLRIHKAISDSMRLWLADRWRPAAAFSASPLGRWIVFGEFIDECGPPPLLMRLTRHAVLQLGRKLLAPGRA